MRYCCRRIRKSFPKLIGRSHERNDVTGNGQFGSERPAFTDGSTGASFTYQQLFDAARQRADSIRNSGAERLVKLDVSNLGTPLSLFASAWAGVPYVPLNYRLTDGEIQALLARVTPAYLVTEDSRLSALGAVTDVQAVSTGSFLDDAQHTNATAEPWAMDPEEIAMLFTSGDWRAKAAVLRHKHLVLTFWARSNLLEPPRRTLRWYARLSHRWYCRDYELGVFGAAWCNSPISAPRRGSNWRAGTRSAPRLLCPMLARIVETLRLRVQKMRAYPILKTFHAAVARCR